MSREPIGDINLEMLKEFSEAHGISGNEKEVSRVMKKWIEPYADEITYDNLGSLVALQKGDKDGVKVMIAGHMDEVGFMVKEITDEGFIHVQPIGSWWSHMVLGQWYTIVTKDKKRYNALMGSMATHGLPMEARNKTVNIADVYLDLGVNDKQDVLNMGIAIGDMVVPWARFERMNDPKYISCKAFDDRVGNYIMIEVARRLKDINHKALYLANTIQEEPVLRGARTATHVVHPDIAFAIDTTLAGDTPMNRNICKLGGGVVLSMIDSNSIAPRKLVNYVEKIAKENDIKYQYAVFNKGGTDSGNIHKTYEGIINMTLSIPIRYMHTNHSIIHEDDVENCIELLCALVKDLNLEKYENLM